MTEQTQPTDALAKLRHLYANMLNGGVRDTASAKRIAEVLLSPAIEALEKWGTPAGAGEVASLVQSAQAFVLDPTSLRKKLHLEAQAWGPLASTSQPTQAQAGAVPLTVDEVEQLIAQWSYELHGDRARYLVRMTEQHHGIKGADHA